MIKRMYPMHEYTEYLSVLSAHMVEFKGTMYATCEHAYHCQRYADSAVVEEIKNARSAYAAWEVSQKYKVKQSPDWDTQKAAVMEEICRAKLAQHPIVRDALIASGDSVIVKDYPDSFWGIGLDGKGQNVMGQIWIKLRKELQDGKQN
jgi:ribA/ribD-fused uncharacterized protein